MNRAIDLIAGTCRVLIELLALASFAVFLLVLAGTIWGPFQ